MQGDIRDQNEARPGCISRDAGATGSWAQAGTALIAGRY